MSPRCVAELPPEILRIIFLEVLHKSWDKADNAPVILPISHACAFWRAVALATQELWASVLPRKNTTWTKACLERCPTTPLDCFVMWRYIDCEEYRAATRLVLENIERVRSLEIDVTFSSQEEHDIICNLIVEISDLNPSNLVSVKLSIGDVSCNWIPSTLPTNLLLPEGISRITQLECRDCIFPIETPWFLVGSNIRSIDFYNCVAWDDVDSMINFFTGLPRLEIFANEFYQDQSPLYPTFEKSSHARSVRLDHLQALDLRHYWLDNLIMFMCLVIPSNTTLNLISLEYYDYIDSVPHVDLSRYISLGSDAFRQHFASAVGQGSSYDAVDFMEYGDQPREGRFWLEVYTEGMKTWYPNRALPPVPAGLPSHFLVDLPKTNSRDIRRRAAAMLITIPVFAHVSKLLFESDLWELYPEAYDAFSEVSTIRVHGDKDAGILASVLSARGITIWPSLTHLHLTFVDETSIVGPLLDALCAAHAATEKFERLELRDCRIDKDALRTIRERLGSKRLVIDPITYRKQRTR